MDKQSLAHTKWECKYHLVFAPKFRRQIIYGQLNRDEQVGRNTRFWAFVSLSKATYLLGIAQDTIRASITRKQIKENYYRKSGNT